MVRLMRNMLEIQKRVDMKMCESTEKGDTKVKVKMMMKKGIK